jgi:hypothetical protein
VHRSQDGRWRARTQVRALLLAAALATQPVKATPAAEPLSGPYGGDRVNATFTDRGARLEFDCAAAEIDGVIRPVPDGSFRASGRYLADHPGPIEGDAATRAKPAQFSGRLEGDKLRLDIAIEGRPAGQTLTFTLVRGKRVKLVRCL